MSSASSDSVSTEQANNELTSSTTSPSPSTVAAPLPLPGDPTRVYSTAVENELKVFVILLQKLKAGKAVSQAAHAMRIMVNDLASRSTRVLCNPMVKTAAALAAMPEVCQRYQRWSQRDTVIALAATEEQLHQLRVMPEAVPIVDEDGDQYVPKGTLVCVAFPPRPVESMREITEKLKLFS